MVLEQAKESPMSEPDALPVAVVGAGPVGLAAAAHLLERGLATRVYEAGPTIAASVRAWGHVRLFSPWKYNIDTAAVALLERHGWQEPPGDAFPTGEDLYQAYVKPLSETPEMAAVLEAKTTVRAITRRGLDKVATRGRETRPFELSLSNGDGRARRELARGVIRPSGPWKTPNPLGGSGVPADGEAEHARRIAYGVPDVLGRDRAL